jgi:hypothetical protein
MPGKTEKTQRHIQRKKGKRDKNNISSSNVTLVIREMVPDGWYILSHQRTSKAFQQGV